MLVSLKDVDVQAVVTLLGFLGMMNKLFVMNVLKNNLVFDVIRVINRLVS